jgi:hypothetical protein
MTKKSSMAGTADHNLSSLVGKKIKSISMQEIDIHGDGQNVRQFYTITCTDSEKFVLAVDGNCTAQYATAELIEYDDFADFLEGIECEQTPEDEDSFLGGEEEDENMFDNDDKLFDDQDDSDENY